MNHALLKVNTLKNPPNFGAPCPMWSRRTNRTRRNKININHYAVICYKVCINAVTARITTTIKDYRVTDVRAKVIPLL